MRLGKWQTTWAKLFVTALSVNSCFHYLFFDLIFESERIGDRRAQHATIIDDGIESQTLNLQNHRRHHHQQRTMIFASVIRQGGLAVVRPAAINNSKTAIIRSIGSTATSSTPVSQQKRGQSYFSASTNNSSTIAAKNTNNLIVNTPSSSWRRQNSKVPIQQLVCQLSSSYHTSIPALQSDAAIAKESEEGASVESKIRSIPPDIRAIILADLKAVDADGNGRIDHEELKTLLRKYNNAFTEASILELSELFYTSLGASSVDIGRFMEALDAAAADLGTSGGGDSVGGERIPLATKGQFKTHALGIGTCASEYT